MSALKIIVAGMFCLVAALVSGQPADEDPYSVTLVQTALKTRAGGIVNAKSQTNLARMGDAVSIAILKIFSEDDLANPQKVSSFLPIIRAAFSEPQFITKDIDKKPNVTIYLLKHIQLGVTETKAKREVQETIQFVREQTVR